MTHTITATGVSITPDAITEFESSSQAGTLVHDIIGRPDPDVTLRAAGTRSGKLVLTFASESASRAAEVALGKPYVFTLTSDLGTVTMPFVVTNGMVTRRWTLTGWIVEVPFREVMP